MKKWIYIMFALVVLGSTPLWAYTVSGKVYYKGTSIPVPGAFLRLTESGGASNTATSDSFGSFSMGWKDTDMSGRGMTLTASSSLYWGVQSWTVPNNTNTESKDIYVSMCIEPNPSINLSSLPLSPGAGISYINPVVIKAPYTAVQVQNAQVNIVFNPAAMNVVNVQAGPGVMTTWSLPEPGRLQVNAEFNPPLLLQQGFPAESFFDVFFEIELPETGAELFDVTVDQAELMIIKNDFPVVVDVPVSTTENLLGESEPCKPHFLVDTQQDWTALLELEWPDANIRPMTPAEWNHPEWGYIQQWNEFLQEGQPYPSTEFLPPELYVYGGGGGGGTDRYL